jgi:outer membrane protein
MKKGIIIGITLVLMLSFPGIYSQSLKLGHINTQELLALMPESDSAQAKLQKSAKSLQDELEQMQIELNKKYQDYQAKMSTYSDLIKQTKEAELQDMNQRIQQFQTTAEQDIQKQRTEIFQPVLDKAKKAISEIAKENKFTYIYDTSTGGLVYWSDESVDILPLVKKKLGLADKPKAALPPVK